MLVLQTSGSSGAKKRVASTSEALVVGALCIARSRQLAPEESAVCMLPLHHVAGVSRSLAPALLGCTLVSAPPSPAPALVVSRIAVTLHTGLGCGWMRWLGQPTKTENPKRANHQDFRRWIRAGTVTGGASIFSVFPGRRIQKHRIRTIRVPEY